MSERSGFPSMTALLGLLAVAGYQNRDNIAEILKGLTGGDAQGNSQGQIAQQGQGQLQGQGQPQGQAQGQLGGLRDILAGLGGAGAGSVLTGGLGELLDRFNQAGHKETADSWVSTGPNKDIAPNDLKTAIGPDILQTLARATGMSESELLNRLSRELPNAVDQYTPQGRISAA